MNILRSNTKNVHALQSWAKSKNATQTFIDNAQLYIEICEQTGVNAEVAYAQYAKESGFGKHNGVVPASYCNPCGLKVQQGGDCKDTNAHKKFKNWREGIQAHVDHLALYAGQKGYPKKDSPDPRHFPYLFATSKTVEGLGGKWAPSKQYGTDLQKMVNEIRAVKDVVPQETISKLEVVVEGTIKDCKINGNKVVINYIKK